MASRFQSPLILLLNGLGFGEHRSTQEGFCLLLVSLDSSVKSEDPSNGHPRSKGAAWFRASVIAANELEEYGGANWKA